MFYDLNLLKKGGQFSIIWIAGTRGVKSVSKGDLINLNVIQVCDNVLSFVISDTKKSSQRFSLVLSAKLISGIIRIHYEQARIFLNNLNVYYIQECERQARLIDLFSQETVSTDIDVPKPKKTRKPRTAKVEVEFTPEEVPIIPMQLFEPIDQPLIAETLDEELTEMLLEQRAANSRHFTMVEEFDLPKPVEKDDFGEFGSIETALEMEALLEKEWGKKRKASDAPGTPTKKKKPRVERKSPQDKSEKVKEKDVIIEEPIQVIEEVAKVTEEPAQAFVEPIQPIGVIDDEPSLAPGDKTVLKETIIEKQETGIFKVPTKIARKKRFDNYYIRTRPRQYVAECTIKEMMADAEEPLVDLNENIVGDFRNLEYLQDIFNLFVDHDLDLEISAVKQDTTVQTPIDVVREVSSTEKTITITPLLVSPLRSAAKKKEGESIESPTKYKAVEVVPKHRQVARNIAEQFKGSQEGQRESMLQELVPEPFYGDTPRIPRKEIVPMVLPTEEILPLPSEEFLQVLPPIVPTDQPPLISETVPETIDERVKRSSVDTEITRKDRLKKVALNILNLHEMGNEQITIPHIAERPLNRFSAAFAFGAVLDLAARRYVQLFTKEDSIEFDHLEISEKLIRYAKK